MQIEHLKFSNDFKFGAAVAAHQVEGGNYNNDWWEFEHQQETLCKESSGDACNFYHMYEEDIKLMKDLNLNLFRFSIEWSRIEPAENEFSKAAMNHYINVAEKCLEHSIEPCITFHHFTTPIWATKDGSWLNPQITDRFVRFCDYVAKNLGDRLKWAVTINEPNIVALMGYRTGVFPPGFKDTNFRRTATSNFIAAHRLATEVIKNNVPQAKVGLSLSMTDYQTRPGGEDKLKKIRYIMQDIYLETLQNDDFVGVQTYSRHIIDPNKKQSGQFEPELPVTKMGYEIYPQALEATIKEAYGKTKTDILVTENGIAPIGDVDSIRSKFIVDALGGVKNCIDQNINVLGYVYWSLLDNFEWSLGFEPKFGLIKVDRRDFRRTVKPSAKLMSKIAENSKNS